MLKLPAFKQYPFATVFQDDDEFWRYYIIPGFPTVRIDEKGNPVFLMIKYALSDESRELDPTLPRGGGYLVFDSELRVSPDQNTAILKDLQALTDDEWSRRKSAAADAPKFQMGASSTDTLLGGGTLATGDNISLQLPPGTSKPVPAESPKVVIGEPLWKTGKVHMNAPSAPGLVSGKVGEEPASMLGNNVAAFSMDLTPDGATFMQKTLVNPDGSPGTDLTPIQVVYDLTMLAKLPPARAMVHVNTASLYHAVHEMNHTYSDNGCDTDQYSTVENQMSMAIDAGIIDIKIDMGGETDEEVKKQLLQQCEQLVQDILKDKLTTKKDPAKPADWGDDASGSGDNIYRLKTETEMDMSDFRQTIELQSTIEYTIHPQGTLETFLASGGKDTKRYVREINLDDDFFKTLGLSVRAYANWDTDNIDFVEVDVKYEGRDSNNQQQSKTKSFTFSAAAKDPQKWDPELIGKSHQYQYRWRVKFKGRDAADFTPFKSETTRDLNVGVETPGKLNIDVVAAGVDFTNIVNLTLVNLKYQDSANQVKLEEAMLLLAADKPTANYQRMIYAQVSQPISYRVTHYLKTNAVITGDWQTTTSSKIVVASPFVDQLDVTLVPAGFWDDVIQTVVSLTYNDAGNQYNADAQYNFKGADEFKAWHVILRDTKRRDFKYKTLTTYKSGELADGPWTDATGDQAIPIQVKAAPRLKVAVMGMAVDYAQTPVVKVSLRYGDDTSGNGAGGLANSVTLTKDHTLESWNIHIPDETKTQYSYQVTYYPASGPPVEHASVVSQDAQLIVPRYDIPRIGADVNGILVDFAATPAVEVYIKYDDAQRNVHTEQTLSFTDKAKQSWFMPVDDAAPRQYQYTITYYLADGRSQPMPPVDTDRNAIMIPKYRPPAPPTPPNT